MATAITYTDLTANGHTTAPAGTTLASAMDIASALPERTMLIVENTSTTVDLTFKILAGDSPPALAAGQGDLSVTVAKSTTEYIGPVESGRFLQSDGTLQLTSSATTGTVTALLIPKAE